MYFIILAKLVKLKICAILEEKKEGEGLMISRFVKRLINVFRWLPVIWNDYEWDYDFFLVLIEKKLEHMLAFWESDAPVSGNKNINISQIRETLEALNRYLHDDYCHNELLEYEHRHPVPWTLQELKRRGVDDEFINLLTAIEKQKQEDFDFVFSSLRKNLQTWWD